MPDWKQEIRRRLVDLKLGPAREVSVVEELAGHLEDYYEELVAGGATEGEAERQTLAELSESGILERELMRVERQVTPEPLVPGTIRRTNMLADIWQDMRYGMRTLLKSPGFTLVAVLTLALGIGANTAIFTLIDAVLLKTLPVKDPEQLVVLGSTSGFGGNSFSYPMFQDLRNRNEVFTEIFAYQGVILNLSEGAHTERVSGQLVSGNFFVGLGVSALLGRVFDDADDKVPSAHPVVLLGHHFWTRRFAGDPGLVGKTIHLNGYPFTVIGILPAGFFGVEVGASPEVWVPRMMQPQLSAGNDRLRMRNNFGVKIMARLEPDVSMEQAQAATDLLSQQINSEAQDLREPLRGFLLKQHIELQSASKGLSTLRRQFKQPLLVLMGMVAVVLLIACANIANLLLARAASRRKEIAVRLALGASRFRLVRQLFTESLMLSLAGALLGLLFAFWATDLLVKLISQSHFTLEIHPDFRVLGFTFGVAVLTGMLFGVAPAIQATRSNLISALKNEVLALVSERSRFELRKILVVAQVALSLLLLVGAGLFVRTLQNLRGVDLGFRADSVLLFSLNPGLNGYKPNQAISFYEHLLERVRALDGVQSASLADSPLLGGAWITGLAVEGYQPSPGKDMSITAKRVQPQFFETMGIPVLTGRDFAREDGPNAPKVAIINETLARAFWSNENPIGRRIGVDDKPDCEVIGVIKDTRYRDLKEQQQRTVYLPFTQVETRSLEGTVHVRTAGDATRLMDEIRQAVQALDRNLPVYNVRTFPELVAESVSQERVIAMLASFFGLLALLLASIGLYGVIAYAVARRTHEIGIRVALGARAGDVLKLVIRQGMTLASLGIMIGLAAAIGLTRFLKALLFGVNATDPLTFIVIALLLTSVALLASWIPARRATKVDPMMALRHE